MIRSIVSLVLLYLTETTPLGEQAWKFSFHNLIIPFFGGFIVTLGKLMADKKVMSFDESNDIALDMVLLAVAVLGIYYKRNGSAVDALIDGGMVDALIGMALLYFRHDRKRLNPKDPPPIGVLSGCFQLALGAGAIIWTVNAF